MKKGIILLLSVISLKSIAQPSMAVTHKVTGASMSPNSVFYSTTIPEDLMEQVFDIRNTSASTKAYDVKRYDIKLNKISATDSAKAHFCFASQCYGASTFTSPTSLTLAANQSASGVSGSFQMLFADLEEATAKGFSHIKYTIINSALSSDSLQFSIKYNDISMGTKQSSQEIGSFEVSPNPVKENAVIRLNSSKSNETKLTVFNALGSKVFEKSASLNVGKNEIPIETSQLKGGIYFVSMDFGDGPITKRIIVE